LLAQRDAGFGAEVMGMGMSKLCIPAWLPVLLFLSGAVPVAGSAGEAPRLILQITVDALRGDLPERYAAQMGEGGLRYLMNQGIHYRNAYYLHANTETIVGHASLATGTTPAAHGMVGNVWFDRSLQRTVYNIEDPDYVLLTPGAAVDAATEIDPTQRAAKVEGRSPRSLLAPTFGDQLTVSTQGRAKVFAVSVKDRGAVAMAGQTGKAFWFSKARGEFVTSSYYYPRYPAWVESFNAGGPAQAYAGSAWSLLKHPSAYLFGRRDDQAFETDFPGFGRTFPHRYGALGDKYLTTRLTLGPAGDRLTLDFAKALLRAEGLGQDAVTDYLSISFSSNDYVIHLFGPSSLECEDNLLRLDRTLAELFAVIDKTIGLDKTLIVLSADHGAPEVPGYLNELGVSQARHFVVPSADASPLIRGLKRRYGEDLDLIESFQAPYLYLDDAAIAAAGLDKHEVERSVVAILGDVEGVAAALSSADLRSGRLPRTPLVDSVQRNFHPRRSGDVYVVFEPNVFIADFDGLTVAATHGSPWRYDSFVPVMFTGAGLAAQRINRSITPYDIAPTLAAVLGIAPPAASIGRPLGEVVGR
jgi:predicted AlkP superfamily pyrophosphatase or phosphodiesterase